MVFNKKTSGLYILDLFTVTKSNALMGMNVLNQVNGIGSKTLQTLHSHSVFTLEELLRVEEQKGKTWGIQNLKAIQNNAKTMLQDISNTEIENKKVTPKLVYYSQHSWFKREAKLPIITEKDNGTFSTAVFPVVIKELVIENGTSVAFKIEYKRSKALQKSPICYSPAFIASLNRNLPLLNVNVNKNQCEIFLVLRSVWEANAFLSMCMTAKSR